MIMHYKINDDALQLEVSKFTWILQVPTKISANMEGNYSHIRPRYGNRYLPANLCNTGTIVPIQSYTCHIY